MTIGVLALQGAFIEHREMLKRLGVDHFEIRQLADLKKPMDGLILPGGESTTMGKLLKDLGLFEEIKKLIQEGLPVFGTCAGLILLAKVLENDPREFFKTMDISVRRNAFGRQLGSFTKISSFNGKDIPMVFIRAPFIHTVGSDVEVLSEFEGMILAAREGNQLVTAYHPELTKDETVHRYFLEMIENDKRKHS